MSGRGKGVHTVPNPNGSGWANEVNGRVQTTHRTQVAAITQGRKLAIKLETEHSIHNREGRIRAKNSYGNDPRNVPG